jgi:hypothetical protein
MIIIGPLVLHGTVGLTLVTASRTRHFVGPGLITAGHTGGDASLNWPSLAVSIVAAAIALSAVIYSVKSTHAAQDSAGSGKRSAAAAERAAAAAEQQTEIQLQLRKAAAQPYVWVDVRPDDVTGVLLNLVVGNSGPTIAQHIRAKIDPPLEAIDQLKDRAETAQDLLARGISSLPPGRTLVWPLGQGFNILDGGHPQKHTITVTADGPFGPVPPLTYVLDLMDYKGHMHRPVGSLHLLTQVVENIDDKLGSSAIERSTPDTIR